jgi:hypothetical protein
MAHRAEGKGGVEDDRDMDPARFKEEHRPKTPSGQANKRKDFCSFLSFLSGLQNSK